MSEGYVGITMDLGRRWLEHNNTKSSYFSKKRVEFQEAVKNKVAILVVLFEGTLEECVELEKELRPNPYIGWNIASGGGACKQVKGKEYYSKVLNKWGTIREWATYAGVSFEDIRGKLRGGYNYTIDQLIGLSPIPRFKYRHKYDKNDEDLAIYYFENTAMTKSRIVKKVCGWQDSAEEFLIHQSIPKWMYDKFSLTISGTTELRVKRQTTVWDVSEIENIHDYWFYHNYKIGDISKRLGYSHYVISGIIRDLEKAYE